MSNDVRLILGFLISTVGGHYCIAILMKLFGNYLNKHNINYPKNQQHTLKMPVGMLERLLYSIAIYKGGYAFIPVWLIFKVSIKWNNIKTSTV